MRNTEMLTTATGTKVPRERMCSVSRKLLGKECPLVDSKRHEHNETEEDESYLSNEKQERVFHGPGHRT